MRDFAVTPKLLSTMAGQVGFERFRLTERYVVESVVCRGGTVDAPATRQDHPA